MSRLDRWWKTVPQRTKQKFNAQSRREQREAEKWLKMHQSEWWETRHGRIPTDGDGRDSAHIEPYAYFVSHDTREDLGDNLDDRDGAAFSALADQSEQDAPEAMPDHRDLASLVDEEKVAAYFGLASTLDTVEKTVGEVSPEIAPAFEVTSGPLRSSWFRVEQALRRFCSQDGKGKRHQVRGGRVVIADDFRPSRTSTKMAFDPQAGDFREVRFTEFNPHDTEALEHERRVMYKKSPRRVETLPDNNELIPGIPVSRPKGPARKWSEGTKDTVASKLADPRFQEWLRSGAYDGLLAFREHLAGPKPISKARLWRKPA
jgi:hypothetical protein